MFDEHDEEMEAKKAGLEELNEFARRGSAKEMAGRMGLKSPASEMAEEPIPGVEGEEPADEDADSAEAKFGGAQGVPDGGGSGYLTDEMSPEVVAQILEKLKGA